MIAQILASMLALATPGVTDASRVQLPVDCQADCRAYWDRHATAPQQDARWMRTRFPGLTRRETPGEAVARWATIAEAIGTVAAHPPPEWTGTPEEMWRALVTIARHESAFWGSVHDGSLRGGAGEVCLLQIHPVNFEWLDAGTEGESLVGTDPAATERCIYAGATILAKAREACRATGPGWFTPTITAYGAGQGCWTTAEWISDREQTFERTGEAKPLPFLAQLELLSRQGWT